MTLPQLEIKGQTYKPDSQHPHPMKGYTAEVYMYMQDKNPVAIKVLKADFVQDQKMIDYFNQCAAYMQDCSGERIVEVRAHEKGILFQDHERPLVVMERMSGSLAKLWYGIQKGSEKLGEPRTVARCYQHMINILRGLDDLHDKGRHHGELTFANVLLGKDGVELKLNDLVRNCHYQSRSRRAGEDLSNVKGYYPAENETSPMYDMFMFGTLAGSLLIGQPIGDLPGRFAIDDVREDDLIPSAIDSLIVRCMSFKPAHRPTAKEALEVLESEVPKHYRTMEEDIRQIGFQTVQVPLDSLASFAERKDPAGKQRPLSDAEFTSFEQEITGNWPKVKGDGNQAPLYIEKAHEILAHDKNAYDGLLTIGMTRKADLESQLDQTRTEKSKILADLQGEETKTVQGIATSSAQEVSESNREFDSKLQHLKQTYDAQRKKLSDAKLQKEKDLQSAAATQTRDTNTRFGTQKDTTEREYSSRIGDLDADLQSTSTRVSSLSSTITKINELETLVESLQ